jgi:hypothetical protein
MINVYKKTYLKILAYNVPEKKLPEYKLTECLITENKNTEFKIIRM